MSSIWDEYLASEYGKKVAASLRDKKAFDENGPEKEGSQAMSGSAYEGNLSADEVNYDPNEVEAAHQGGGTKTEVSNAGTPGTGAYGISGSEVKAAGDGAKVETISEQHEVHDQVARKQPTGVQGAAIKGLSKTAGGYCKKHKMPYKAKECPKCGTGTDDKKKKKAFVLHELVKLADYLDEKGLAEEAKLVDEILQSETTEE